MNTEQVTIVCLIKAKQATKNQVKKELSNLTNMTRLEAGCMNYDLHISAADDSLFIIYENWRNQATLDNHMSQQYLKDFLAKESELLERPVDGKICRIIK
ncbi:MAG: putative quinol monooxygenase [Sedimentisphaerales bacterium]